MERKSGKILSISAAILFVFTASVCLYMTNWEHTETNAAFVAQGDYDSEKYQKIYHAQKNIMFCKDWHHLSKYLMLFASITSLVSIFRFSFRAEWFWWLLVINLFIINFFSDNFDIVTGIFIGLLLFKNKDFLQKTESNPLDTGG